MGIHTQMKMLTVQISGFTDMRTDEILKANVSQGHAEPFTRETADVIISRLQLVG